MSQRMAITLPWPPSVNHYWKLGKRRGTGQPMKYISDKGVAYRAAVMQQLLRARPTFTKPVRLRYELCPPTRRVVDIDNFNKSLWDALTHARVWADDSLVDEYHVRRGPIVKGGVVRMVIDELVDEPGAFEWD